MKTKIEDLVNYDWNGVMLYGKKSDPQSWRWDSQKRYVGEEVIAIPQEILESSTPYTSMEWEMDTEESEDGYEDECQARDEWLNEEYEVKLPLEEEEVNPFDIIHTSVQVSGKNIRLNINSSWLEDLERKEAQTSAKTKVVVIPIPTEWDDGTVRYEIRFKKAE